jgi:PhzF family phenazine biosynthesis protein
MHLPIYQIDALVPLDRWLSDEVLQAIANENNLAETAFVIPDDEDCPLRWFTPTVEVDLCGHATLATADVLFREYFPGRPSITFTSLSGTLTVEREQDRLVMDFPSRPGKAVPPPEALITALGGLTVHETRLARDLMVVVESEEEVRAFQPDFARLAAVNAFAVVITAPGDTVDFVSRFFAPNAGIPEDPVTGSSHCSLIPYWAERLDRPVLTARQLSRRGGTVYCELAGARVRIGGTAVEYMRGRILV